MRGSCPARLAPSVLALHRYGAGIELPRLWQNDTVPFVARGIVNLVALFTNRGHVSASGKIENQIGK